MLKTSRLGGPTSGVRFAVEDGRLEVLHCVEVRPCVATYNECEGGGSGSWNRYAYVEGDPIGFMDSSGLMLEDPEATGRMIEAIRLVGRDDLAEER